MKECGSVCVAAGGGVRCTVPSQRVVWLVAGGGAAVGTARPTLRIRLA